MSVCPLSGSAVFLFIPFSGIFESPDSVRVVLWVLFVSLSFFVSKRLRSGAFLDLMLPPKMFSRATEVEADALGVFGHDPYQLWAFLT